MRYRIAAWTLPGSSPFEQIDHAIPVTGAYFNDSIDGRGRGWIEVDASYDWQALIHTDSATPANNRGSLIRFYKDGDDNTAAPVFEFKAARYTRDLTEDGTTIIHISDNSWQVAGLDEAVVRWWDWETGATKTQFPDHVYGGQDLVANPTFLDTTTNEVQTIWNDATGGTWRLTVVNSLGTDTTTNMAFDISAGDLETEIRSLTNISDVAVGGAGTETDPWEIEFVDPGGEDYAPVTTIDGGLTGDTIGSTVTTHTEGGAADPTPWTKSQNPQTGISSPGSHGTYASDGFRLVDAGDPAWTFNGGAALRINGLTQFAGAQQIIQVTPGSLAQASIDIGTTDAAARFRFVIRDINEQLIASSQPFGGVAGGLNAYAQVTIDNIAIPDDLPLGLIVLRIGVVSTGNPAPFYLRQTPGIPIYQEGLGVATLGRISNDLIADQQVDHQTAIDGLPWLAEGAYTDALDSNGDPWIRSENLTVPRGRSYGTHVYAGQFADLGYEYELVPNPATDKWDLELYNAGGRGVDGTAAGDTAFVWGMGISGGRAAGRAPTGTDVLAEGAEGVIAETGDATQRGIYGRVETFLYDQTITDTNTLLARADQLLDEDLANLFAVTVSIDHDGPDPYNQFGIGDTRPFLLPGLAEQHPRRISAIEATYDGADDGWRHTVTASRLFEPERALAEAVRDLLIKPDVFPNLGTGLGAGFGIGSGFPIVIVAANNSPADWKAAAQFVCTDAYGDDDITIQAAIDFCPFGGTVLMAPGEYYVALDNAFERAQIRVGNGDYGAIHLRGLTESTNGFGSGVFVIYDGNRAPSYDGKAIFGSGEHGAGFPQWVYNTEISGLSIQTYEWTNTLATRCIDGGPNWRIHHNYMEADGRACVYQEYPQHSVVEDNYMVSYYSDTATDEDACIFWKYNSGWGIIRNNWMSGGGIYLTAGEDPEMASAHSSRSSTTRFGGSAATASESTL